MDGVIIMWQIMLCVAVVSLILEMFIPSAFFLNFSIAGFICAILACYVHSTTVVIIVFCVLSLLLLLILRPIIIGMQKGIEQKTGMDEKYVGKTAVVIEDIDKTRGIISMYDERWQARNVDDGIIPAGSTVEIVGHESIIMKVKAVLNA